MTTRADLRPGMVMEVRQRYVVGTKRYLPADHEHADPRPGRAGLRKLDHLLPDRDEWHLVRGRWRVRWRPPFSFLGAHIDGFWIAEEQDRRDGEDGDPEWYVFDTWAEAIAYADRQARRPL